MSWGPRTIHGRLALGFAAAVALTVLVYAGVVYGFTRSALLDQLDARLHDDFERAEHAFEVAVDGSLSWKDHERIGHHDAVGEDTYAEILHPSGEGHISWPPKLREGAGPFRQHMADCEVAGETYTIRVGRSLAPMQEELRTLLILLALCLLPVVWLAWIAGQFLAHRALRPVALMTARAKDIGAERLSERLPVGEAGDELDHLASVFNEAFARLERSFDQLRRFTSDAAHELRTPLAALRTVGEVAVSQPQDAETSREVIGSMLEETERLTRLVSELLELSRGDAGVVLAVAPMDLAALVQSVCEQLEVLASEREQSLVVDAADETLIQGNEAALRRALTNLVDNAIRHGPAKARIHVGVEAIAAEVQVTVHDEGEGIPAAERARLFDRFYRIDTARAGTGTGLGLALAAQAAAAHGGRIEVESPSAGGTTFRLTLPSPGVA